MISIRDPEVRPSALEMAALASASAQSTNPLSRICQVALLMVRSRQRLPVGETTSMEPVLKSPSLNTCDCGAGFAAGDQVPTMPATTQRVRINPQARNARQTSPEKKPVVGAFCARKVPASRMLSQYFVAASRIG